jgi:uncharacterized protein YuzB (UPF0349 family)
VTVIKRKYENRLAKLIKLPGGKTVAQALADADTNLDSIRDDCLTAVDENIQRLLDSAVAVKADPSPEALAQCYAIANEVFALAGVFGMAQLGKAAYSLCELIDRSRDAGKWSNPAFDAHMNALRLLRFEPTDADRTVREAVLGGLREVVDAVTGPPPVQTDAS